MLGWHRALVPEEAETTEKGRTFECPHSTPLKGKAENNLSRDKEACVSAWASANKPADFQNTQPGAKCIPSVWGSCSGP